MDEQDNYPNGLRYKIETNEIRKIPFEISKRKHFVIFVNRYFAISSAVVEIKQIKYYLKESRNTAKPENIVRKFDYGKGNLSQLQISQ